MAINAFSDLVEFNAQVDKKLAELRELRERTRKRRELAAAAASHPSSVWTIPDAMNYVPVEPHDLPRPKPEARPRPYRRGANPFDMPGGVAIVTDERPRHGKDLGKINRNEPERERKGSRLWAWLWPLMLGGIVSSGVSYVASIYWHQLFD